MGGYGSGRDVAYDRKHTVEEYYCLSAKWLRQHGFLRKYSKITAEPMLRSWRDPVTKKIINKFTVQTSVTPKGIGDTVEITFSEAPLERQFIWIKYTTHGMDSERVWLECPDCSKNRSKLYSPGYMKHFKCRECYGLIYKSQRRDRMSRLFFRARKIHQLLGGDGNVTSGQAPPKPPGMHWKTYTKKVKEFEHYYNLGCAYVAVDAKKFMKQLNNKS